MRLLHTLKISKSLLCVGSSEFMVMPQEDLVVDLYPVAKNAGKPTSTSAFYASTTEHAQALIGLHLILGLLLGIL